MQKSKLSHLLIRRHKSAPDAQGFTLIDVLVAVVILSVFSSVAMTAMATAVVMKSQARVKTEASNWIEQDLEAVRTRAAQLYVLSADAAAGQAVLTLNNTAGLAAGEQVAIGTNSALYTIQSISSNTVRLTTNLTASQSRNASMLVVSKCNPATSQAGYAYALQQSLPAIANGGTRTILGKTYTLTRSLAVSASTPYKILQVGYTVAPTTGTASTTNMYSEVIPNAVFQCPNL